MIKDILLSFRDNFREKATNPFLGTYLIVWIIRNWELVYSLFNFNPNDTLEKKVIFIKSYYENNPFVEGSLWNIVWTFGVLVLTYFLLSISRAIVNLFEKQLKPWIYKKTDSKSIVLKSTYELIRNERDDLQLRLDKERESKSRLETIIKSLEEQVFKREQIVSKNEEEEIHKEKEDDESFELEQLYYELLNLGLIEDYKKTAVVSKKGEGISFNNKTIDKYLEFGLLEYLESNYSLDVKFYKVTEEGDKLLRYLKDK